MRVVVFGATGNVGTSVVRELCGLAAVEEVVGIARRRPSLALPKVEWRTADIARDELTGQLEGADAVIHLAWAIQPSRDEDALRATNVDGSARVFDAVVRARVPTLLYASSVGAYSPGPKDRTVDEGWPTGGVQTSFYSRHKAEVEALLDELEAGAPGLRAVRMRPALIFKREAATEIRRLFLGPFVPRVAFDRRVLALVPRMRGLRFQAVHTDDVARAFAAALIDPEARGAYNLAAEPVLDPERLAGLLGAREVPAPPPLVRGAAGATWRARLQPSPPGWLDMALATPLMSSARARNELGWEPRTGAGEALLELLDGMRRGAGAPTPPLDPGSSGPFRVRELRTGVGARAF